MKGLEIFNVRKYKAILKETDHLRIVELTLLFFLYFLVILLKYSNQIDLSSILLLAEGRTAFLGSRTDAIEHFSRWAIFNFKENE